MNFNEKHQLLKKEIKNEIFDFDVLINDKIKDKMNYEVLDRILYIDTQFYLQEDILTKVDRASMANSLEVRAPFLDYRIMEFAAQLPTKYKLYFNNSKYILKKSLENILPKNIVHRKKKGFGIPIASWINESKFRSFMLDYLSENEIAKTNLFDYNFIKMLLSQHFGNLKNNDKQIWNLLVFQIWYKNLQLNF
jgi:asparagine synthase (glutamine-hydrolysing)